MRFLTSFTLSFVLLLLASLANTQSTDLTVQDRAVGLDVVDAVLRKISRSKVFNDDGYFLKRVALVESRFGHAGYTFDPNYYGGIWQVSEANYNQTKDASLSQLHRLINLNIDPPINWTNTRWTDLIKPLYSGIAARLFFYKNSGESNVFPYRTLTRQANYWSTSFNNNPTWNASYFSNEVRTYEETGACEGRVDLCIVLDGSGSIGANDFRLAKNFTASLVGTFSLESSRIGFVVYSSNAFTVFPVENRLSIAQMQANIINTGYPGGGTSTGTGIRQAVALFRNLTQYRPDIPKLIAVFTDGYSTDGLPYLRDSVEQMTNNSIISFGVGIGAGVGYSELLLIAQNNSDNVFIQSGYEELSESFRRLNEETCEIPQRPEINQTVSDSLKQNEKRYYNFIISGNEENGGNQGVTIRLSTTTGQTRGFYSYSEENPSSAFYDGLINGDTYIPRPAGVPENTNTEVFIAIEGLLQGNNTYTLEAVLGNQVSSSGAIIPNCMIIITMIFALINYN